MPIILPCLLACCFLISIRVGATGRSDTPQNTCRFDQLRAEFGPSFRSLLREKLMLIRSPRLEALEAHLDSPESAQELSDRMHWALNQLPENQVTALGLYLGVSGPKIPMSQIASALGVTSPTIRTRVDQGILALRALDENYDFFNAAKNMDALTKAGGADAISLKDLGLEEAVRANLWKRGFVSAGQISRKTFDQLSSVPQIGEKRAYQIALALEAKGLNLKVQQMTTAELKKLSPAQVWALSPSILIFPTRTGNALKANLKTFPTLRVLYENLDMLEKSDRIGPDTADEIKQVVLDLAAQIPPPP